MVLDLDSELAVKAAGGDRAAFEQLVKKHQGAIYSYAYHFFRNAEIAEDATQDTFLRAFRFLHTFDPSRRFITWLYSIARTLCIDRHRERVRYEQINIEDVPPGLLLAEDDAVPYPLRRVEEKERRRILLDAVRELPEKYRTPIILCYMQGLSYQEVSEVLGISLNNTKIRIFRAKNMLIDKLEASEES